MISKNCEYVEEVLSFQSACFKGEIVLTNPKILNLFVGPLGLFAKPILANLTQINLVLSLAFASRPRIPSSRAIVVFPFTRIEILANIDQRNLKREAGCSNSCKSES